MCAACFADSVTTTTHVTVQTSPYGGARDAWSQPKLCFHAPPHYSFLLLLHLPFDDGVLFCNDSQQATHKGGGGECRCQTLFAVVFFFSSFVFYKSSSCLLVWCTPLWLFGGFRAV